jgi:hypothetical protein
MNISMDTEYKVLKYMKHYTEKMSVQLNSISAYVPTLKG